MHIRDSFRNRFPLADVPVVVLVTYVTALLAWLAVVGRWVPMPGGAMDAPMRMSDPGVPEAMALSNGIPGVGLYLAMWGVMMVAMMYPSSVPLFRLYYRTIEDAPTAGTAARVVAFMGTYALVWTLTGVVPLVVNAVVPLATIANRHTGFLLGGTLLLLAGYQVSPYKHRCLRYCRSPLGFLMSHHRPGVRGAVRTSVQHSVFCAGCCWALFAFMVVVGSMNIVWMALVTIVLSLERTVAWGGRLARGTSPSSRAGPSSVIEGQSLALDEVASVVRPSNERLSEPLIAGDVRRCQRSRPAPARSSLASRPTGGRTCFRPPDRDADADRLERHPPAPLPVRLPDDPASVGACGS